MRLTLKEALNILNGGDIGGSTRYNAELLKKGIKQGKFPFGVYIEGDDTDYYPDGKTVYVIESERLMKWIHGADIGGTENDI